MGNRFTALAMALLLLVVCAGLAFAADGNKRKGKMLYRKHCKTCHTEGGSAMVLGPDSKTMAQWERQFKERNIERLACKDEWAKVSAEDLNDIYTFLYEGAFDSPTPAKCK